MYLCWKFSQLCTAGAFNHVGRELLQVRGFFEHVRAWRLITSSVINPAASAHELIHYFGLSDPVAIATDPEQLPKVEQALSMSPNLKVKPKLIMLGKERKAGLPLVSLCAPVMRRRLTWPIVPFGLHQRLKSTFAAIRLVNALQQGRPSRNVL